MRRQCLKCQKMFTSEGSGNRVCQVCCKQNNRLVKREVAKVVEVQPENERLTFSAISIYGTGGGQV